MKYLLIIIFVLIILISIYMTSVITVKETIANKEKGARTYTTTILEEESKQIIQEPEVNNDSNPVAENDKENEEGNKSYNVNKYDVQYHDPPEKIEKEEGYGLGIQSAWVFDPKKQKAILMQVPKLQTFPTYEIPGYYKYGYSTYSPNYVESIILSSNKSG